MKKYILKYADFGSALTRDICFLPKLSRHRNGTNNCLVLVLCVDNIIIYVLNIQIILYINIIFLKDKYRPNLSFLLYIHTHTLLCFYDHLPRRFLRLMIPTMMGLLFVIFAFCLEHDNNQWSE